MPARDRVSLGILAGGRGTRLGGVDKAFLYYRGEPLLQRVFGAAGAGFADRLVSHNDPLHAGRALLEAGGIVFVGDKRAAGEGPLAGLHALLYAARGEWLLTLPVDLREPEPGVIEALLGTEGAMVRDADGMQPLVALWPRVSALCAVEDALVAGERAVQYVASALRLPTLDMGDARLGNLNTPADFDASP